MDRLPHAPLSAALERLGRATLAIDLLISPTMDGPVA